MARDYAVTLRGILNLANDMSTTQGEREKALQRALKFAAAHGIDIAMLEQETTGNLVISKRIKFTKPFAKDKGRLWGVISRSFGCKSVRYPAANVYRTYGYKSDLGMADTLFDLLWEHGCIELGMAEVPYYVSAKSFSTAFWAGYENEISNRLDQARNIAVAETTGAELVLVSRKNAVEDEFNKQNPNLRSGQTRYIRSASGWSAGTQAGQRANLGHPLTGG